MLCNSVNVKRLALQRIPIFQLSKVHRQQSAFITCFVQTHCILHVQFVSCLRQKAFDVWFRSCHQKIINVSSCFLFDVFSTWFKANGTSNRRIVIVHLHGTREDVRTVRVPQSRCSLETRGMPTRLPICSLVPALPLEVARFKLGFLFRLGSKSAWWKAPLQSPIAATCPFRAAQTNIILKCIIAAVAEKKSSFPFRVRSYPRVVHLASSLHRRAWCPPNVLSRVWWSHRFVARL